MKPDPDQRWLRTCFDKLREEDQRCTPAFERVWQTVERPGGSGEAPGWRLALGRVAAAGVLAAAGLAGVWLVERHAHPQSLVQTPTVQTSPKHVGPREPEAILSATATALSNWQSPTAFLLDTSDDAPSLARPSPNRSGGGSAPARGGGNENF